MSKSHHNGQHNLVGQGWAAPATPRKPLAPELLFLFLFFFKKKEKGNRDKYKMRIFSLDSGWRSVSGFKGLLMEARQMHYSRVLMSLTKKQKIMKRQAGMLF